MRNKFIITAMLLSTVACATAQKKELTELEKTKIDLFTSQIQVLMIQQQQVKDTDAKLRTDLNKFIADIEKNHPGMTLDMKSATLVDKNAKAPTVYQKPTTPPVLPNQNPIKK